MNSDGGMGLVKVLLDTESGRDKLAVALADNVRRKDEAGRKAAWEHDEHNINELREAYGERYGQWLAEVLAKAKTLV